MVFRLCSEHIWRDTLKKQFSLLLAIAAANYTYASDAFDQFLADSTVNVKARSILVQLNSNDVEYDASEYDAATSAAVLFGTGANAYLGTTGTALDAFAGADQATVETVLPSDRG